jgi:SAM-dependent methyltransferase
MEHSEMVRRYLSGYGVEIGAFKTPIPGIKPVYVDRFAEYANEPTLAEYYGDACNLPFFASSLRYVASSHVLEHVANPLAALSEWFRVLRHGGIIYMVIPDRCRTFDHTRPLTSPGHLLADYRQGTSQSDATHIDDFVYGVDWRLFSPSTPPSSEQAARDELASIYHASAVAGREINLHYHTFESSSTVELIEIGNREAIWPGKMEILQVAECFPDSNPIGFLIVARVLKPWRDRGKALFAKRGLLPSARKLRGAA